MKLLLLLVSAALAAQVKDTAPRYIGSYTVATLPAAASWSGYVAVVTDASTTGSCTSGGGSAMSLCRSTGSAWTGLGGSLTAGSGITIAGSTVSADTAVMLSRATAQAGTSNYCRSTTGNDTYTCALTPTLTAYTTGGCLVLNPDTANTLTATINVDTLGAKSILNRAGAALATGDITANKPISICYDGTQYIIQGDGGGGALTMTDVYWPFGHVTANGSAYNPGAAVQKVYSFTPAMNLSFTKLAFVNSGTGYTAFAITTFDGASIITNATASCNNNTDGSGNGTTCSWAGTVSLTAGTTYRLVWAGDAATGLTVNSGAWVTYNNGSGRGFVFSSTRSVGDATATATGTGATLAIAVALGTITAATSETGSAYPIVAFIP